MRWIRRLWFWTLDTWLGALWPVRHHVRPGEPGVWASGDGAPVLLLPGVYENWQYLVHVGRRLHAAGHPVHVLLALGRNSMAVPDAAALAQRYLERHALENVVLVAHSKGGLIGKHMMAVDDTAGRIARMVAISTPFSGSVYARYTPVRTLRAFRPADATLSRLAQNLAINERITSVYAEFDPVIPARSRLEGAVNVEVPMVGHFRVLRDPVVLATVLAAVDPG